MARYTHNDVPSGYTATQVNDELEKIETAINDMLDRKGGAGNQMEADLDMNSYDIMNAESIRTDILYLGGEKVLPSDTLSLDPRKSFGTLTDAINSTTLEVGDKGRIQGAGDFEIVATNPNGYYVSSANGYIKPLTPHIDLYGADPSGASDSSEAIVNAINDNDMSMM